MTQILILRTYFNVDKPLFISYALDINNVIITCLWFAYILYIFMRSQMSDCKNVIIDMQKNFIFSL